MSLLVRRPRRERTTDRRVDLPGGCLKIFRRRRDGYVRIEIENFGDGTMVELYLTDEERQKFAEAFSSSPAGTTREAES